MTDNQHGPATSAPDPGRRPTRSTDPLTPTPTPPDAVAPQATEGAPPPETSGQPPHAAPVPHAAGQPPYAASRPPEGAPVPHAAGLPPYAGPPAWSPPPPPGAYPAATAVAGRPRRTGLWVSLAAAMALVIGLSGFGIGRAVGALSQDGVGTTRIDRGIADDNGQFPPGFDTSPYRVGPGAGTPGSDGPSATGTGAPGNLDAIAAQVSPAVVNIVTTFGYQRAAGAGTGIVLSSDGLVVTNNHVIDGATSIRVTDIGNGETYSATVVGYSATSDLAVLRLTNASGLATATIGDSSAVSVGDGVVALGNAGGRNGAPIPAGGSITALGQTITAGNALEGTSERLSGLIQVNAAIQSGDSGGPLVDANGKVIGIDVAASANNGASAAAQGYAIPINDATAIVDQVTSGQGSSTVHVGKTAFLGVTIASGQSGQPGRLHSGLGASGPGGATIAGVVRGGAADRAGLVAGDTVTAVGSTRIAAGSDLSAVIATKRPGDTITLHWVDARGASHTRSVTLGSGPPA